MRVSFDHSVYAPECQICPFLRHTPITVRCTPLLTDVLVSYTDIDILRLSETETRGKYIFDVQLDGEPNWRLHKALIFARQQLLDEIAKRDCNVLLLEGCVSFSAFSPCDVHV